MNKKNKQNGFMQIIVLFVIFCIIVWYFEIDIRGFVDTHPQVKNSFISITNFLKVLWNSYLLGAGEYIWNNIIIDLIWNNLSPFLSKN